MRAKVKAFSERNLIVIGAIGVVASIALVLGALNYDKLPFFSSGNSYSAYFDEAGGLTTGAPVRVSGFRAGKVQSITLDGQWVLVTFTVDDSIRLGDRTEASIKTTSVLGNKVLDLTPGERDPPPAPSRSGGPPRRISCPTPSGTSRRPSVAWTPTSCPSH